MMSAVLKASDGRIQEIQMKNPKAIVLVLLMVAAFADGAVHQLTAHGKVFGPSDMVFNVVATLLVFAWYRFDSDERAYKRTPFLNVAIIALLIVALPYYLFRSRGFMRGSIAVGLSVLCCAGYFLLQTVGEYAMYYGWQS
jgi:hypothetical protein